MRLPREGGHEECPTMNQHTIHSESDSGSVLGLRLRKAIETACADMEPDEQGPTLEATQQFVAQLEEVFPSFSTSNPFPLPHVDVVGDGRLMAEWSKGSKKVLVLFSREGDGVATQVDRS